MQLPEVALTRQTQITHDMIQEKGDLLFAQKIPFRMGGTSGSWKLLFG